MIKWSFFYKWPYKVTCIPTLTHPSTKVKNLFMYLYTTATCFILPTFVRFDVMCKNKNILKYLKNWSEHMVNILKHKLFISQMIVW